MVAQLLDFEVSGRLPASGHRVLVAQARPKPERAMRPAATGDCLSRPSQPFARRSWPPCPPRLGPFGSRPLTRAGLQPSRSQPDHGAASTAPANPDRSVRRGQKSTEGTHLTEGGRREQRRLHCG